MACRPVTTSGAGCGARAVATLATGEGGVVDAGVVGIAFPRLGTGGEVGFEIAGGIAAVPAGAIGGPPGGAPGGMPGGAPRAAATAA